MSNQLSHDPEMDDIRNCPICNPLSPDRGAVPKPTERTRTHSALTGLCSRCNGRYPNHDLGCVHEEYERETQRLKRGAVQPDSRSLKENADARSELRETCGTAASGFSPQEAPRRVSADDVAELDRQIADYKARCDGGETVSGSDARWLLNEMIYQRDHPVAALGAGETPPCQNVWVVTEYLHGGLRGVFQSQAAAETEIAAICAEHPDLTRSDFIVRVERLRGAVAAPPAVQAPQLRDEALRADNAEIAHQQTLQRMQRAGEILVDLKFWPAPNADQNLARDIGRVLLGQSATHSAGVEEALAEAGAFAMSWKQRAEKAEAALPPAVRWFPIQGGPAIPWSVIERHEVQAKRNHDQTLQRLAERGGLSPCEAVAVLEDREWHRMDDAVAKARLNELAALPAPQCADELESALQQPVQPDRTIPLADLEQRMRSQALRTSPIHADLLAFADELAGLLRTESQS